MKVLLMSAVLPALWFLITFCGAKLGLSASEIVTVSASAGLMGTFMLFLLAASKPGLITSLFTPRQEEATPL